MSLFTARLRVTRHHIEWGRDGRGRCEETRCEQRLWREWLLRGRVIFRWEIDRETVPVYVWAGSACLGDTCGWVSKFAPFDRQGVCQSKNERKIHDDT